MNRVVTRISLVGSGTILSLIGGALMFVPKAFLEMSHVVVERDPGLMSELTAPSGVLLITGALMILGAVKLRFVRLSLFSGAMVYGSYGVGRLVSMVLHGVPSQSLVTATLIELTIATFLIVLLTIEASVERQDVIDVGIGEVVL